MKNKKETTLPKFKLLWEQTKSICQSVLDISLAIPVVIMIEWKLRKNERRKRKSRLSKR